MRMKEVILNDTIKEKIVVLTRDGELEGESLWHQIRMTRKQYSKDTII